ncbi:MAG: sugar-binding protein [Treponema sp.]|jgi:putative multiple sugar transport system substrate-binding protein|nr:sugar-binding protein [Treponema sp.]
MKKLSLFCLTLVMAFAVVLTSCPGARDGAPLIGIAMPETHVERWIGDGNQLRDEAIARGFRAEVMWADANQAVQNTHIQSFIVQGAELLIIGSINEGVGSAVAEAAQAGIPVIAYDRIISGSGDYDYFITFNNYEVGRMQGQSIVDALNLYAVTPANPRRITLFAGSPTDGNAFFFFDGAMSVLLPHIDRGALQVVGPFPRSAADMGNFMEIATPGWMPIHARTRMDNLLTGAAANVILDAVLAPNDTLARTIIESLRADARYQYALPIVTGQDAEFDSMISIRDGNQHMTVFKDTNQLAAAAVLLAYQILNGLPRNIPGTVLAEDIGLGEIGDTGVRRVNTFLLEPILVTRDNINVPVDAGFFTVAEAAILMQ